MSETNRREEEVRMFLMSNAKYFNTNKVPYIKEKLEAMNDSQFMLATSIEYKDPMMMLIVSLFGGSLGIDRFMLGDTGMGVLKLLTVGVCGILTIIDWFGIQEKTREYNLNKLLMI